MNYRDQYKSDYELRREKQNLGDRWHDPNVQRRWAADDRIHEIDRELRRSEDEQMEREAEERRQQRAARERKEERERELANAEYEEHMDRLRQQELEAEAQEIEAEAEREMLGDDADFGLEDVGNK